MASIQDARRLSAVVLGGTLLVLLWYLFLRLQASADFRWFLPERALESMTLSAWTWVTFGFMGFLALAAGFMIYAIPVNKETGRAKGALRQVQCQACRAVFRVTDHGERPLTHVCPSCSAYGVYDSSIPPVGEPPVATRIRAVKRLELTCKKCEYEFQVTDTGARPLRVQCPSCTAVGRIH